MNDFTYRPMFELGEDTTAYRKLDVQNAVSTVEVEGHTYLKVAPHAIEQLAFEAFKDCSHLLRPSHMRQLRTILDDEEASDNDKFVAFDLIKNANIAAGGVLPMCQDTGTAIVAGKHNQ